MLDIGWSEMAVVALVALVIIGPKDLPRVMRTMGHWMRKARAVSREFQSSIDEMVREAELEDARKAIQSTKNFNIERALDETVDPSGDVKKAVQDVERAARDDGGSDEKAAPPKQVEPPDSASSQQADAAESDKPAGTKAVHHTPPPHSVTPPKEPEAAAAETSGSTSADQKSA